MKSLRVGGPRPASLCSVFIETICSTPSGELPFGKATGFHYRDPIGRIWLITNWHVVTGRRPDDPSYLLPGTPQSPHRIKVTYQTEVDGQFLPPLSLDIYPDGEPLWYEYRRADGVDIAAIPIELPSRVRCPAIQDFCTTSNSVLQPGMDVVVVGFPFEHSRDMPYPIWKRAMVASEPGYMISDTPQMLLDAPGMPGMSGSPVYRVQPAYEFTGKERAGWEAYEAGNAQLLEVLASFDAANVQAGISLEFVGIYAGATSKQLDRMQLGRTFFAPLMEAAILSGERGRNPFPPEKLS